MFLTIWTVGDGFLRLALALMKPSFLNLSLCFSSLTVRAGHIPLKEEGFTKANCPKNKQVTTVYVAQVFLENK